MQTVSEIWAKVLPKFCAFIETEFPDNVAKLKPLKTKPFWAIMQTIQSDLKPAFDAKNNTLNVKQLEAALDMKLTLSETQLKRAIEFVEFFIQISDEALKTKL